MDELKKNQIYEAEITGYTSTGAGVCRIGGRAVFVPLALAGEVWDVQILKVSSSAVYGKGVELKRASPARAVPDCPVFGKCGGCDLMHMDYAEELKMKLARVNDAIARIGGLDFTVEEILGADEDARLRYRNKAIFAVGKNGGGRAVTGFYRERSHDVVPAPDCLIQTEAACAVAAALRRFMDENHIEPYDEKTGKGQIRHVFTRCSLHSAQTVAVIVSARGLHDKTDALVSALHEACSQLTGVVLCINKDPGNVVLNGEFHTLWGDDCIEDTLCGLEFRISPQSFYQVNPRQAEKLYERAVDYACPDGGTALDLYCGTGTISLCLARRAKQVYGVEIVPDAVENARRNAERNGVTNAEFLEGDAFDAAKKLGDMGVCPDAVVVDPPRKGLAENVIEQIAAMGPARVVYVSCDPGTLARDLAIFDGLGYKLQKATAVDMFPRCAHVETVVLMSRVGVE